MNQSLGRSPRTENREEVVAQVEERDGMMSGADLEVVAKRGSHGAWGEIRRWNWPKSMTDRMLG